MNLFESLERALAGRAVGIQAGARTWTLRGSESAPDTIATTKPILQLNALPVTIDPHAYEDPLSTSNPAGRLDHLWAFRQLVDPVPEFARYYSASGSSTESIYSTVVRGASVIDANPFAAEVISQAIKKLALISHANMDGTPGTWAPVHATPGDWYIVSADRYKPMTLDLGSLDSADSPYAIVGGQPAATAGAGGLVLRAEDGRSAPATRRLAPATRVEHASLRYLEVTLSRPWYHAILFDTSGWKVSGQPDGFCSSGKLHENTGVLPLLPTSIIFATEVEVVADWHASDQRFVDDARARGQQVSLGPLVVHPAEGRSALQVLGWVTSLVPYSPRS